MFQSLFGTDNWILETEKLMRFVPSLVVRQCLNSILEEESLKRVFFFDARNPASFPFNAAILIMKVDSYDLKEIISYFKIFELCVGLQGGELWHARHNEFYAIWPDDATNETLEHLVFRALQCSWDISVNITKELNVNKYKMGIGAGECTLFFVGGMYNQWKYLLSGAPYEEGLLALKMAKQRDIIVSYSAWELQKGTNVSYCTGKPLSNDKFILLESINRNITPVSKPNSSNLLKSLHALDVEKLNGILKCVIPDHLQRLLGNTPECHLLNWSEQSDISLLTIVVEANGDIKKSSSEASDMDESFESCSLHSLSPLSQCFSPSSLTNSTSIFYSINTAGVYYRCLNDRVWTMTQLSEGFFSLTGYPREHLLQNWKLTYWDLIIPEDRNRVWEETQAAIEKNQSFTLEYTIVTASGELKKVWKKGHAILSDGGIILEGFITQVENSSNVIEEIKEKKKQLDEASFQNLQYLQSLYLTFQDVLLRYQSFIYDFKIIGHRAYITAPFGIFPSHYYRNDTFFSIKAGKELLQIRKNDISFITVAYGKCAYVQVNGSLFSCFMLSGEVFYESEFISQFSQFPPSLICNSVVCEQLKDELKFKELQKISLPNKTISVFQIKGERPKSLPSTLISRDQEMDLIMRKVKRLVEDQLSGVIIIEGEAGMGKSTLIEKLKSEIQSKALPLILHFGAGSPVSTAPCSMWYSIFLKLFDIKPDDSPNTKKEKIESFFENDLEIKNYLPLFNCIIPECRFAHNSYTLNMNASARVDKLRSMLCYLLQDPLETPQFLIVEDCHHLDSNSWSLLHYVIRIIDPLLVCCTTRPTKQGTFLEGELEKLKACKGALLIQLQKFTKEQTTVLISSVVEQHPENIPNTIIDSIYEKSEGNPLLIKEYCRYLWDKEKQQFSDPGTNLILQGIIHSRINEKLTPSQKVTLKTAACIGTSFPESLLRNICPESQISITENLAVLVQLNLLTLETKDGENIYSFSHEAIKETVYDSIPDFKRNEIHSNIALWFETNDPDNFYLLAQHYTAANNPDKSLKYLLQAGHLAAKTYANQETIQYFSLALRYENKMSSIEKSKLYAEMATAYLHQFQISEAKEFYGKVLEVLNFPVPEKTKVSKTFLWQHSFKQNIATFLKAKKTPDPNSYSEREKTLLASSVYSELSDIYRISQEIDKANFSIVHAIVVAEPFGPTTEVANALAVAADYCIWAGWPMANALSIKYYNKSKNIAHSLVDPYCRCVVSWWNGLYLFDLGKWDECKEELNNVEKTAQSIGFSKIQGDATAVLGVLYYFQGDFQQARNYFHKGAQISLKANYAYSFILIRLTEIKCSLFIEGKAIKFLELVKEHENTCKSANVGFLGLSYSITLGTVLLFQGKYQEVHKELQSTLSFFKTFTPLFPMEALIITSHAELLIQLWYLYGNQLQKQELKELIHCLDYYLQLNSKISSRIVLWQVLHSSIQSLYSWLSGKHSLAISQWNKLLDQTLVLDLPLYHAKTLLYYGFFTNNSSFLGKAFETFNQRNQHLYGKMLHSLLQGNITSITLNHQTHSNPRATSKSSLPIVQMQKKRRQGKLSADRIPLQFDKELPQTTSM